MKSWCQYLSIIGMVTLLVACQTLPIDKQEAIGQDERIQSLVLHFTATDFKGSLMALKNSGRVSSHYLIPDPFDLNYTESKLNVIQLVEESSRAWHAGNSSWQGRNNLNDTSIGIEIVNVPSCRKSNTSGFGGEFSPECMCRFPDFAPQQILVLTKLIKSILARHPDISPTRVVGHSDVAPGRKSDPGPRFPWYQLYREGIGAWYDEDTQALYGDLFDLHKPSMSLIQMALKIYGYDIEVTGELDRQTQDVLYAFQLHFLPWEISGQPGNNSLAALFALVDKYHEDGSRYLFQRYSKEWLERGGTESQAEGTSLKVYGLEGEGKLRLREASLAGSVSFNGHSLVNVSNSESTELGSVWGLGAVARSGKNVLQVEDRTLLEDGGVEYFAPVVKAFSVNSILKEKWPPSIHSPVPLVLHSASILAQPTSSQIRLSALGEHLSVLLAVHHLVELGKLGLEQRVAEILPEFRGPGRAHMRVSHLLNHASGYAKSFDFNLLDSPYKVPEFEHGLLHAIPDDEIRRQILTELPVTYGLNTRTEFSLINVRILSYIVNAVTGGSLSEFLHQTFFQPMALKQTFLAEQTRLNESGTLRPFELDTNREELAILLQLLLNDGRYGYHKFWTRPLMKVAYDKLTAFTDCDPFLGEDVWFIRAKEQFILLDQDAHLAVWGESPSGEPGGDGQCPIQQPVSTVLSDIYRNIL